MFSGNCDRLVVEQTRLYLITLKNNKQIASYLWYLSIYLCVHIYIKKNNNYNSIHKIALCACFSAVIMIILH